MSVQKPKAVYAAIERLYTAAGRDVQVQYLGVVLYEWRKAEQGDCTYGLVKQTQFCVSFIVLWRRNGGFQTWQSCQFFNRSLLRSLPRS